MKTIFERSMFNEIMNISADSGPMLNIHKWYTQTYPDDELGDEINDLRSFGDLYDALLSLEDPYKIIGVGDSVIRERIFQKLAEELGVDYSQVYDLWLKGGESRYNF